MLEPRSVFLPVKGKPVLVNMYIFCKTGKTCYTLLCVQYTTYCIVHLFPLQFCEQF